jgi:hypothetical protein
MTSRRWRWVSARVLTNLWLTALNRCSPHTSVSEGKPSWLPDCLLDQGRNVAEYLAVLPSGRTRDCECPKWKALWIYGWTEGLTVPAGACMH